MYLASKFHRSDFCRCYRLMEYSNYVGNYDRVDRFYNESSVVLCGGTCIKYTSQIDTGGVYKV